jgi:integrase
MYQLQGQKRRMTLGKYPQVSLKEARKTYEEARARVARGFDPGAERIDNREKIKREREEQLSLLTVSRLADDYIERHAKPNKRSWEQDQAALQIDIIPNWGSRKAADITRRDVNKLLDKIIDRGGPIAANRRLSLIRKMFNFGMQRGELNANPCFGMQKPSPEHPKDRVLSDYELRELWAALNTDRFKATETIKLAIKLQLLTATRIGEIVGTRWDEIDLDGHWWEIPLERMKNKKIHRVWLTATAVEILDRARNIQTEQGIISGWVFTSPYSTPKDRPIGSLSVGQAISRNIQQLGIDAFTPHDLRRTVSTRLAELGILPHIADKVLSHTDSTVRGRHYDKFSYDFEKRKALEAWAEHLREIVTGDRRDNVLPLHAGKAR